jgi:hypothetical protein
MKVITDLHTSKVQAMLGVFWAKMQHFYHVNLSLRVSVQVAVQNGTSAI